MIHTFNSATNVCERIISNVVTPKIRFVSFTWFFLKTSTAIGTVELTGFVIIAINAFGQVFAAASHKSRTILAFVLNKSSRVIPQKLILLKIKFKLNLLSKKFKKTSKFIYFFSIIVVYFLLEIISL